MGNSGSSEVVETGDESAFLDLALLDDFLVDVLSYVPGKELIKTGRLVCKEFKKIIDGHSVWKIKCQREKKTLPRLSIETLPVRYYELIYFHNPYGRNLLENPCGEDQTSKWKVTQNYGDGWVIENPPKGSKEISEEVGTQSCFATSYGWCVKHQIVDLLSLGIPVDVLNLKTTKIQIGEWYAARFDCGSVYKLNVALYDETFDAKSASEISSDSAEQSDEEEDYSDDHDPQEDQVDEEKSQIIDRFHFSRSVEQWSDDLWLQVTHTFENVGKARYVFFQHSGKDLQFWAGNYGCKCTGAFVKVIVD